MAPFNWWYVLRGALRGASTVRPGGVEVSQLLQHGVSNFRFTLDKSVTARRLQPVSTTDTSIVKPGNRAACSSCWVLEILHQGPGSSFLEMNRNHSPFETFYSAHVPRFQHDLPPILVKFSLDNISLTGNGWKITLILHTLFLTLKYKR